MSEETPDEKLHREYLLNCAKYIKCNSCDHDLMYRVEKAWGTILSRSDNVWDHRHCVLALEGAAHILTGKGWDWRSDAKYVKAIQQIVGGF